MQSLDGKSMYTSLCIQPTTIAMPFATRIPTEKGLTSFHCKGDISLITEIDGAPMAQTSIFPSAHSKGEFHGPLS